MAGPSSRRGGNGQCSVVAMDARKAKAAGKRYMVKYMNWSHSRINSRISIKSSFKFKTRRHGVGVLLKQTPRRDCPR